MLDTLRSSASGFFAKLLLAFLVITFGIWGIGDVLRNPTGKLTIAKVGDTAITSDEYVRAMRREAENLRRIMGDNFSPEILKDRGLSHHVLQQLIHMALLKKEAEDMGLVPSDADVVRRIRTTPAFQDEKGNFDKTQFETNLKNMGTTEKNYVETIRHEMATTMLIDTLSAVVPVPDMASRTLLQAREEGRSITFYALKPSVVSAVPMPDETQIKKYYDIHAREFTAPEYRTVSYVTLSSANASKETKLSDTELKEAYNQRLDEFKHPERRAVEQLLYPTEDNAKKAYVMLKSGKSFDVVAKETDIMNKSTVSLGKVEKGTVLEAAADRIFSLKSGEFTQPMQSPFGWHVFKVTSIDAPSVSAFEEVKPQLEKEMNSRGADDAVNKLANKFQDQLAGGSTLTEAAKEFNLKLATVGPIDHEGKTPDATKSAELPDLDKFIDVAFKTDDGIDSQMTTSKNGVYYIVHVDKTTAERLRTLDEVRGLAASGWQKEEREKHLGEVAKELSSKFPKASERTNAIAKYNLQTLKTVTIKRSTHAAGDLSLPPQLVADVFTRKVQEGSEAYLAKNGDYMLGTVDAVIPAPTPENDTKSEATLKDIHKGLELVGQNELLQQHAQYLMQRYPVTINESALQAVLK